MWSLGCIFTFVGEGTCITVESGLITATPSSLGTSVESLVESPVVGCSLDELVVSAHKVIRFEECAA